MPQRSNYVCRWIKLLLICCFIIHFCSCIGDVESPWDLPVVPSAHQSYESYTNVQGVSQSSRTTKIPKLIWVGYRVAPMTDKNLSLHINKLKNKNPDWKMNLWGNDEEHRFMETYFANTSILWAFKSANPAIGVTWGDIWRYCVLWAFGGFYLDDDSYMDTPLSEIVRQNDTMIVSLEKKLYADLYVPHYKLSKTQLLKAHTKESNDDYSNLFDRPAINWAIFSEPQNLVLEHVLRNVVDIFKLEYLKRPVFNLAPHDMKAQIVFLSTGLTFLASSIKEYALMHPNSPYLPRPSIRQGFAEYGGVVKINDEAVSGQSHYMSKIARHNLDLLVKYETRLTLESLESRFIIARSSNQSNHSGTLTTKPLKVCSSKTTSGEDEITLSGIGFSFYRVKGSALIVYPDMHSFLAAFTAAIESDAPRNIETVDIDELNALFRFMPQSRGDRSGVADGAALSPKDAGGKLTVTYAPYIPFKTIITSNGKSLFLVEHGGKMAFPDYDTFTAMGFSEANVTFLPYQFFYAIPLNGSVPSLA